MSAIVLTWNPRRWAFVEGERTRQQVRTESGRLAPMEWSIGRRRSVPTGQRAFLLRQGDGPRGIVASGWTRSLVDPSTAEDPAADRTHYVQVDWDFVVDEGDPLPVALLSERALGVNWNSIRQSGIDIPDTATSRGGDGAERCGAPTPARQWTIAPLLRSSTFGSSTGSPDSQGSLFDSIAPATTPATWSCSTHGAGCLKAG